jgi:hypothetical protein
MNGAILPKVLYFLVIFNPGVPVQPLSIDGPMDRVSCQAFADPAPNKEGIRTYCREIHLK